jgi:hypothetical protein
VQGWGERVFVGVDPEAREAHHLAAVVAEEVGVFIFDCATGISELVAPDAVTEIHADQELGAREVGKDSIDGGFVDGAGADGPHDLFVGHGGAAVMELTKHGDSGARGAHATRADQMFELVQDVRVR